jgi:cystathionine beta-lyase
MASAERKSGSLRTLSLHSGSPGDPRYGGTTTPLYTASAYDYETGAGTVYPRYFNTPNQQAAAAKIAALEGAEAGILFSSGMAAIMTALFANLKKGDHAVFQSDLYGGTLHAIVHEFPNYGIEYTLVDAADPSNFAKAIRKNTKLLYIETPSNPTLRITDIAAAASLARKKKLLTMIDNTFASPVNQNPFALGIDIVAHSGTKYIGGHSDLCCGAVAGTKKMMEKIWGSAIHFGGSPDPFTSYLVERSLKTIVLRVQQQNENAMALAEALSGMNGISRVYYPGLSSHAGHKIAKRQMPGGFGGMLSFEVKADGPKFISRLKLIRRAVSLGGVESTICSPAKTSHAKISPQERASMGVTDNLVRMSVGIEDVDDLLKDIRQALRT